MLRLFVEMGSLDEAHAVASVLVGGGQADHDEATLYQQYRPRGVIRAHGRLTEELWQRHLYHPDEDRGLSQMLATLSPAIATRAREAAQGPRPQAQAPAQRAHRPDGRVQGVRVRHPGVRACQPPDVYLVPESPGDVDVVNVRGAVPGVPTLVIGRKLFEMESDIELAFVVGRTLAADPPRSPAALAELRADAGRAGDRGARRDPAGRSRAADPAGGHRARSSNTPAFLSRTMPPQVRGAAVGAGEALRGRARRRSGRRRRGAAPLGARRLPDHDPRRACCSPAISRSRCGWARRSRRPSASIPATWCATCRRLEHVGELLRAAHLARPTHDHAVAASAATAEDAGSRCGQRSSSVGTR